MFAILALLLIALAVRFAFRRRYFVAAEFLVVTILPLAGMIAYCPGPRPKATFASVAPAREVPQVAPAPEPSDIIEE